MLCMALGLGTWCPTPLGCAAPKLDLNVSCGCRVTVPVVVHHGNTGTILVGDADNEGNGGCMHGDGESIRNI